MDCKPGESKLMEEASACIDPSSEGNAEPLGSKEEAMEIENATVVTLKEGDNEPKIGMMFSNEEEAYSFYSNYGKQKGFTVRRHQYRRLADGTIRKRLFVCSKEGISRRTVDEQVRKFDRMESRTGCPAMIMFTVEKDAWVVSQFICEHNHEMIVLDKHDTPLRFKRRVGRVHGDQHESMSKVGSQQSNAYLNLVQESGGSQNTILPELDLGNKRMRTLEAEDVQGVMNHFKRMQADDPSFLYAAQVDSETRMTNFFWRDGRSKIDYNYFGDVVVFDTSYRTSKYNMICAPLLGVNHHKQHILFGCAFLLTETTESFIWLFESFLEAMGRQKPRTIFTSQCQAIVNAVEKVFPEAQHRFCLWHIGQNATKHIGQYYGKPKFRSRFDHCINDCVTEKEFEEKWDELLREYDLLENQWLKELHKVRAKWSSAFNQDCFSADIVSMQRSESMNNVLHDLTSRTISLTKFVAQYEAVAELMRRAELLEDLRCNQGQPPSVGKVSGMVKQAAIVYTHAIFQIFHDELCECLSVAIEETNNDGIIYTYKLIKDGDKKTYFVKFNASNCVIGCSCKKFESTGLLCFHCLRVYNARNIFQIPSMYILKRWTKWAKDGLVMDGNGKTIADYARKPISFRMGQLMHKAVQFAARGALTNKVTKMGEEILEHGLVTLENALKELKVEDALVEKEVDANNDDEEEKRCKKNKTQVEHASNNASTTKSPRGKKSTQDTTNFVGKNPGSKGLDHVNTLRKPPSIPNQSYSPAIIPDVPMSSQFELQGCVAPSVPLSTHYMPLHPSNEGSIPSRNGHHRLQDSLTPQTCAEVDLNSQMPHLSQASFPSWIGHHSSENTQPPQACTEDNLNSQLPRFNQESSGSWTFSRPSL